MHCDRIMRRWAQMSTTCGVLQVYYDLYRTLHVCHKHQPGANKHIRTCGGENMSVGPLLVLRVSKQHM